MSEFQSIMRKIEKYKFFLTVLIFFIFSTSLFSQQKVFTIKGYVFDKNDSTAINNYPIRIYPNLKDTTQKYTIYTSNSGFFYLTLPKSEIKTGQIILKISSHENDIFRDIIDTIEVIGNLFEKNYFIIPYNFSKYIINGYVRNSNDYSNLAEYFVYICDNLNDISCEAINTNRDGFFSDTIYSNSNDTPTFTISVFTYCSGIEQIITQEIKPLLGTTSLNFDVCPQNTGQWQLSIFNKQSDVSNEVFFSAESNYPLDSVSWNFGDGFRGKGNHKQHNFKEGAYKIQLIGYKNGISKTVIKRIVVGKTVQIDGKVYASGALLPSGYVLAYKKNKNTFTLIDFANIIQGTYKFESLLKGNYLLYAIPEIDIDTIHFPKYLATYNSGNVSWQKASTVQINGVKSNFDINLEKYTDVYYGKNNVNFSIEEQLIDNYDIVSVLLMNSNDELIETRSLKEKNVGKFYYLPAGKYSIQLEIAGVYSNKYSFDLKNNNNPFVNFFINDQGYIDYKLSNIENRKQADISIYPNPFDTYFIINSDFENLTLDLYSLSGNLIIHQKLEKTSQINSSFMEKGLYLAVISLGKKFLGKKIIYKN